MSAASGNSYLRSAVLTAMPEQLHLMLIDGAIKFALQGKDALTAKNYEESYNKLSRAQAIIVEMLNGLRREINPELCDRMAALYNFIYRKLIDGSVQKDPGCIDDAVMILQHQRETWVLLIEKVAQLRAGEASPSPPNTEAAEGMPGSGLSVEG